MSTTPTYPDLGFGLGLRAKHMAYIFEHTPAVDWFEIISENYMDTGGKPLRNLARIAEHYPIVMHGVSLSIGTVDPLNSEYLYKLKRLIDEVNPAWVSDHLCWTGVAHESTHDLLPVPYTEEALKHITQRLREVQDFLERPIALENPSTYLEFSSSTMPEAEFIARMVEDSGCNLLLDVNNVYVSCYNHRIDAKTYLDSLPLDRVIQIHLSGHSNKGSHIIDTHDNHVIDDVWNLYRYVLVRVGRVPATMVEWDDNIPEFPVLLAELNKAKHIAQQHPSDMQHLLPHLGKVRTAHAPNKAATLADQQHRLHDAIIRGNATESEAETWIRANDSFAPSAQLGVYINAYRWRLFDIVTEDYPALKAYLGKPRFDDLIEGFIKNVASRHFNVARYAATLPDYLVTHTTNDKAAHELCMLETAIAQLADAPETPALTPEDMAHLTPETLMSSRLHARGALNLFAFEYAINDYYHAVKQENPPAAPTKNPSFLAVFRHEDVIWRMDIEMGEHSLLQQLFMGHTIGEALAKCHDVTAENISSWFSKWMRNGLLAKQTTKKRIPANAA